ncbi:MAG: translocation/assembly module TamB domain-containing protein, partial [Saprospiraceae bacterium]
MKRIVQSVALIILFILIAFFLINSTKFLSWSKSRIIGLLKDQIENKIEYQSLEFNFFNGLHLKDLVIYDQHEDTLLYSKNLEVNFGKSLWSLVKNELTFDDLDLEDSKIFITHYKDEAEDSFQQFLKQFKKSNNKNSNKLEFNLKVIAIKNLILERMDYNSLNNEIYSVEEAHIKIQNMDLLAQYIQIEEILLKHPRVALIRYSNSSPDKIIPISIGNLDSICIDEFVIVCKKLVIENGRFAFDKCEALDSDIPIKNEFNSKHFFVNDVELKLSNLIVEGGLINSGEMQSSCTVNNEFNLQSIKYSDLTLSKDELNLKRFKIFTENSHIGDSLNIQFVDDSKNINLLDRLFVQFLLRDTRISMSDLLYFIPILKKNEYLMANKEIQAEIAGLLVGRLNNLKVFNLVVDIPNKLEFRGDAFTRDIVVKGEALLNLNIKYLVSSSQFIQSLIPSLQKIKIFDQIGKFRYTGRFDGYFEDFVSYGTISSDLGVLRPDLRLNLRPGVDVATWSGSLTLQDFNLGQLLHVKDLGKVSMKADIRNGKGLRIDRMNAELKADIYSLLYRSYNYQNIHLDAKVNKDLFDGEAKVKDKNLDLIFKGRISNFNSIPKLLFNAEIAKADLKALNFSNRSYIISGNVESDLSDLDIDKISGDLRIKNGLIYDYEKNHILNIGNIAMNQRRDNDIVSTSIESDIINFNSHGDYKLKSVYNQIMSFLNKQYPEIFIDLAIGFQENPSPIFIESNFELKDLNKVSNFFDLNVKSSHVYGDFIINSETGILKSNIKGDLFQIKNVKIDTFKANMSGSLNQLEGEFVSSGIKLDGKYLLKKISVKQSFLNSTMHFKILARDSIDSKDIIAMSIGSVKDGLNKKFYLEGKGLILNGDNWFYDKDASFTIGKNYLSTENLRIFDSISEVRISDIDQIGLNLDVKSFELAVINPFIKSGSLTFAGLYDLKLRIANIFNIEKFEGNLNILNTRINKVSYGRIDIAFNMNDPSKPMAVQVSNNYKETSLIMNGSFNLPLSANYSLPRYDFDLIGNTQGFQMYFLESFITSISQTKGTANGPIRIYRKNKKIYLEGDLITSNASTKVNYLNTTYFFNNQKIRLRDSLIIFENILLTDELNNSILVDGKMIHSSLTYFTFDINLKSKKALVLNTTKYDNIYYYGYCIMGFQCSFKGLSSKMDMDFVGKSEKGSKFNIPVNTDVDSKDIKFVKFRTKDTFDTYLFTNPVVIKGLNVHMDVEFTEDCEMSIIFDEKSGDILKVNGNGNLQIEALRDNTFTINGYYQISSGQYLFTLLNFVNKPFKLKKGGRIIWTGDPLDADINVNATYEGLNISPAPLLDELSITDERVKERTRVDLTMNMRGSLLKPDINFKLSFPDISGGLRNL